MDLGSSICLPKNPRCLICPLQKYCQSFALGVQTERPLLPEKTTLPHYMVSGAIIQRAAQVLIAQRPPDGLLGGLWEFPGGKWEAGETAEAALQREIREELGCEINVGAAFGVYPHAFTHFRITLHAFLCQLSQGEPTALQASQIAWVNVPALEDYPMGKVDRLIAIKLKQRPTAAL